MIQNGIQVIRPPLRRCGSGPVSGDCDWAARHPRFVRVQVAPAVWLSGSTREDLVHTLGEVPEPGRIFETLRPELLRDHPAVVSNAP